MKLIAVGEKAEYNLAYLPSPGNTLSIRYSQQNKVNLFERARELEKNIKYCTGCEVSCSCTDYNFFMLETCFAARNRA